MFLNIDNAISYMFKDKDCKKKLIIGSLFMVCVAVMNILNYALRYISDLKSEQLKQYIHLLPHALLACFVLLIICFVLGIFTSGYFARNINLRIFRPDAPLPDWTGWADMFWLGLKSNIAICIYCIVLFIIWMAPLIFFCITIHVQNKAAIILSLIFMTFLALIIFIFAVVLISSSSLAFCTNLQFASFFNFSLIKKFITKNFFEYFIYLLLIFAITIMANIVNFILTLTIAGIPAIPFVLFYQFLIINDLAAQFIRRTLEINENKQEQNNE